MMATCLECEENFDLDEEVDVEDVVACPACGTKFEILDLDPVVVDYAPQRD